VGGLSQASFAELICEALFRLIVTQEMIEMWAEAYGLSMEEAISAVNMFYEAIHGITSPDEEEERVVEHVEEECEDDDSGKE